MGAVPASSEQWCFLVLSVSRFLRHRFAFWRHPARREGRRWRAPSRQAASAVQGGLCLILLLLVGCDNARNNEEGDAGEDIPHILLCHAESDGSFRLLEQPLEDLPTHLLNGDGVPMGPVPGKDGFVFTAQCRVTADTDDGPCLSGMAHLGDFCIDRWEAHVTDHSPFMVPSEGVAKTLPGVIPQGYISGEVAEAACQAAGKRLCTSREWLRACRGPRWLVYPYGNTYVPAACNEGRAEHPVVELFGADADWSAGQMNDARINQQPNTLAPAGSHPVCMSVDGVFDLHGNLHEWVSDATGTFRGGFYVDATINGKGCTYRTTAHGRSYHDYSTGFRCCSEVQ